MEEKYKTSVNQRIKFLYESFFSQQKKFAEHIGISEKTVSNVLLGTYPPKHDFLEAIALKYPTLNARWLLTGHGEMWLGEIPESQRRADSVITYQMNKPDRNTVEETPEKATYTLLHQIIEEKELHILALKKIIDMHEGNATNRNAM